MPPGCLGRSPRAERPVPPGPPAPLPPERATDQQSSTALHERPDGPCPAVLTREDVHVPRVPECQAHRRLYLPAYRVVRGEGVPLLDRQPAPPGGPVELPAGEHDQQP